MCIKNSIYKIILYIYSLKTFYPFQDNQQIIMVLKLNKYFEIYIKYANITDSLIILSMSYTGEVNYS